MVRRAGFLLPLLLLEPPSRAKYSDRVNVDDAVNWKVVVALKGLDCRHDLRRDLAVRANVRIEVGPTGLRVDQRPEQANDEASARALHSLLERPHLPHADPWFLAEVHVLCFVLRAGVGQCGRKTFIACLGTESRNTVALYVHPAPPNRQLEERWPPSVRHAVIAPLVRRLSRRIRGIAVSVATVGTVASTFPILEAVEELLLAHLPKLAQERLGCNLASTGVDRRIRTL